MGEDGDDLPFGMGKAEGGLEVDVGPDEAERDLAVEVEAEEFGVCIANFPISFHPSSYGCACDANVSGDLTLVFFVILHAFRELLCCHGGNKSKKVSDGNFLR